METDNYRDKNRNQIQISGGIAENDDSRNQDSFSSKN